MPKRPALRRSERSKKQTTDAQKQNENQKEDEMSQNARSSDSDILGNEEFMQHLRNQNVSHRSITATQTRSTDNPTNPGGNSRQENPVAGTSRRKTNKPSRRSFGTNVLQQIRHLQNSTHFLIPKRPLARVIREVCADLGHYNMRFTTSSLLAIQEATETYLTIFLQDSYVCTLHRDRKTLSIKDMRLVRYLRGPKDLGNV